MIKVLNHRLTRERDPFPFVRSPNQSSGRTIAPEYLVMHYTAGRSAASSVHWLTNPDAKASAHLVIGRDGSVTQLVAFNRRAWHAGHSRWKGRSGLNDFSIGIELDNMGKLKQRRDGSWYAWFGTRVPDDEVLEAQHSNSSRTNGEHTYTDIQIEVAVDIAAALTKHYGLKDIIGHDDIAPARKSDPGPAFAMANFRDRVFGRDDSGDGSDRADEDLLVTTANLNIRSGPGTGFDKLDVSPLPPGTRLEALEEEGRWLRVFVLDTVNNEMDIEGWVHRNFVASA